MTTAQTEPATRSSLVDGIAVGQAQHEDGRVPLDEARAVALQVLADEAKYYAETPLTRRIYVCATCGHETLTVGFALPKDSVCFMRISDRTPNGARRASHKCGGALEGQFLDRGADTDRYGHDLIESGSEDGVEG